MFKYLHTIKDVKFKSNIKIIYKFIIGSCSAAWISQELLLNTMQIDSHRFTYVIQIFQSIQATISSS